MNHKKLGQLTLIVVLVGALVVSASWAATLPKTGSLIAAAENQSTQRSITVTGSGAISVKPDLAVITVGVQTRRAKAEAAQKENAAQMEALTKAIKGAGIADADLKTSNYSIYEDVSYDYEKNSRKVNGYVVSNNMTIQVRDIAKVSGIIDLAGQSGANNINGIYFTVADESKYYNEALKAAVKNAKGKGDVLAVAGGVAIGQVLQMAEASYGGGIIMKSEAARDMAAGAATPIEAGSMEITANVTVTYAIQ